jgi:outer membrane protein TolC
MKKQLGIITITIILFGASGYSQQIRSISKAEVISKVEAQNTSLKISLQDYYKARADYRQTHSVFLPNIKVSHTGFSTTNPIKAFGSKLNQGIITASDFDPDLLNNPDAITNFSTIVEIQQPLINIDGVYQRKSAKASMKAVELNMDHSRDILALEVENYFMQLQLAYKSVDVFDMALNAAKANQKIAANKFEQGFLLKADLLNVDIRVSEVTNKLREARTNVKNLSDYLLFLMNEHEEVVLKPSDSLFYSGPVNEIVEEVSEERSDIKSLELISEAYRSNYNSNKMAFLPRLNAFGSYELYDDELFRANASGYLVGAQLSWDLFEGFGRIGKTQKSKAEYNKSKLEYEQYLSKSNLELDKAARMFADAEKKIELAELVMKQAEETLRIRANRFKEGLEKTSDLLLAEALYSQKQLEYYQTVYQYNYAWAYIKFLTKG